MPFYLSVSGSTILSDSSRLSELFAWGCSAIEIGSFSDEQAYSYVLRECRKRHMRLAIHSPFYKDGNRYGLLQGEGSAWTELERDLSIAQRDELAYVLIHFPYFSSPVQRGSVAAIRKAAHQIVLLSQKYQIPVLIEPKLGPGCDHSLLRLLHALPLADLEAWGLAFCIDVGDLYIASKLSDMPYLDLVSHLAPLTHAVHLHDVAVTEEGYIWTPITGSDSVPIAETLTLLRPEKWDIYLVLEHTPHLMESTQQVQQGINWLRSQQNLA